MRDNTPSSDQQVSLGRIQITRSRIDVLPETLPEVADYGLFISVSYTPDAETQPFADVSEEKRIDILTEHLNALLLGEDPDYFLIGEGNHSDAITDSLLSKSPFVREGTVADISAQSISAVVENSCVSKPGMTLINPAQLPVQRNRPGAKPNSEVWWEGLLVSTLKVSSRGTHPTGDKPSTSRVGSDADGAIVEAALSES